jgi:threonine/homoserine/homoserine lactone efflux protein
MTQAVILGIICGAMPGPVLSTTFTEILQNGYLKCLRIILLAMVVETAVALASLIAFSTLHLTEALFQGLSLFGAGILFWLAASIWKINRITGDDKLHFSFGKIAAMILSNGVLWTYWIVVCVPRAIQLGNRMFFGQYAFVALVEMG